MSEYPISVTVPSFPFHVLKRSSPLTPLLPLSFPDISFSPPLPPLLPSLPSRLTVEPFNEVPVLWVIHERCEAHRFLHYYHAPSLQPLYTHWQKLFAHPAAVIFTMDSVKVKGEGGRGGGASE